MSDDDAVARYYDRNTGRFLRFGGGRGALAIHRELWAPGVETAEDAKRTVNRLLGDTIAAHVGDAPTVLDLGCGVGGTLMDLADRFPGADLHGITVSPRQVEMARSLVRDRGIAERCRVHLGDFQDLSLPEPHVDLRADALIAVESFAHARDPAAFFRTVADRIRPGGIVLIVDDFLTRDPAFLGSDERRLVDDFARGWRLGGLSTPEQMTDTASAWGLTPAGQRDLTPLVRLGRPRDWIIRAVAPLFARAGLVDVPFFGNMIGGNALQEGIRRGILSYRMLSLTPATG